MKSIKVNQLVKVYRTYKKPKGLGGAVKSFFHREYLDVLAVDKISFDVEEGEIVGFIGPNGAGKTTTLKMLSGLLYPTSGQVDILGFTPWQRKGAYLSQMSLVMGQKNQLWWDLPAQETFSLNKEIYRVPDKVFEKSVGRLVKMLDFGNLVDIPVRNLSLGERMKAELIAALVHSPKVLFLDEPTIGLDVVMQQRVREFIHQYNQEFGSTVILTSHYMEDVKVLCKRVIVINKGKIVFDNSIKKLIEKYAQEKTFEINLEKKVAKMDLEKIGKVVSYDYPKAVISVPRRKAKEKSIELYTTLPVEDLNIQELDLAEIVRRYFEK